MTHFANSRQLAARQRKVLIDLDLHDCAQFGSRNKTVAKLLELGFVDTVTRNHRHIVVEITSRGRIALERQARGVDPYIVMTE